MTSTYGTIDAQEAKSSNIEDPMKRLTSAIDYQTLANLAIATEDNPLQNLLKRKLAKSLGLV